MCLYEVTLCCVADGTVNNPAATTTNSCPSNYRPYWYGCYKVSIYQSNLSEDSSQGTPNCGTVNPFYLASIIFSVFTAQVY